MQKYHFYLCGMLDFRGMRLFHKLQDARGKEMILKTTIEY